MSRRCSRRASLPVRAWESSASAFSQPGGPPAVPCRRSRAPATRRFARAWRVGARSKLRDSRLRAAYNRHSGANPSIPRRAGELVESIIVFDMDGVLTEVSESYREAIVQTVARLTGHQITRDLIQQYKNQGGWNNDWALSHKIAADLGVHVDYSDVVDQFNKIFLGSNRDGLIQRERWFPQPGLLERLMERFGI